MRRNFISNMLNAVTLSCIYALGLTGCGFSVTEGTDAFTITTSSLPDATVNLPYSTSLSGSGGTPPYTWSVTPALPANLLFNPTTGAITGTPVAAGTSSHTFALRDATVPPLSTQKTLTLTIKPPPVVLTIITTSLPDGYVSRTYNEPVQATGGTPPLTWSIIAGTLPPDLSLNPLTGVISGTPTTDGTSAFTVRVADMAGQAPTQALSIRINPPSPPKITTTKLTSGTVGLAYSERLQAAGGTGTLVWSLFGGSLPTNVTLSSDGTISGTPTIEGTSKFTVIVTDALARSDMQGLSISVSAF